MLIYKKKYVRNFSHNTLNILLSTHISENTVGRFYVPLSLSIVKPQSP